MSFFTRSVLMGAGLMAAVESLDFLAADAGALSFMFTGPKMDLESPIAPTPSLAAGLHSCPHSLPAILCSAVMSF